MQKAFIFDMDGVIINTEQVWHKCENDFLDKILGKELSAKIGDTVGVSVNTQYEKAKAFGFTMSQEDFQKTYDEAAFRVYDRSSITVGVDKLADFLILNDFKLGLVSSSPRSWIDQVLPKLSFRDKIASIISLNDRTDLKPKPNPDGYLETIRRLKSRPKATVILEDSNSGIKAAKASGTYTIAFSQNLIEGYKQIAADAKACTMPEVIGIVNKFLQTL